MKIHARIFFAGVCIMLPAFSQPKGPPPPPPGRPGAAFDITGYWVAVITEDWRYRMIAAPKGDFTGIPLNAEGAKVANAWDPARDEAAGNSCKSYGAPAIMRVPTRLHITWDNDTTLKIETDAGTQTRLLHFTDTAPANAAPSLQGYSSAQWERQLGRSRGGEGQPGAGDSRGGDLKVVTTNLLPGYLRKNGPPYSANTSMTEYFDLLREADGEQWLLVKTIVQDPTYLTRAYVTSPQFKKQANANGWAPGPCFAKY